MACASLIFASLGMRALWDPDETRYAEIAREILVFNDWTALHLNYFLWFDKPPLVMWLTALSFKVFGPTEFAARACPAFFGLASIFVMYLWGRRWMDERCGLLAASMLATSTGFFAMTQYLNLDMALAFWITLSLYYGSELIGSRHPQKLKGAALGLGIAWGFGVLTKGPVAVVLPLVTLVIAAWVTGEKTAYRRVDWKRVVLPALLIAAPWFIAVSLRYPEFLSYFFLRENFQRFTSGIHLRTQPWWFLSVVLTLGFVPWVVFLPKALVRAFAERAAVLKEDTDLAVMWVGVIVVFGVFSVSRSQLASYILPCLPLLCLIVAREFDEAMDDFPAPAWVGRGMVVLIALFFGGLVALKMPEGFAVMQTPPMQAFLSQAGSLYLMLGLGVFLFVGAWGMRQTSAAFGAVLLSQALVLSTVAVAGPAIDPWQSTRDLVLRSIDRDDPHPVIAYRPAVLTPFPFGAVFYLERRVGIVGDNWEFAVGKRYDDQAAAWLSGDERADAALAELPRGAWLMMTATDWNDFRENPRYERVDTLGNRVLARVR